MDLFANTPDRPEATRGVSKLNDWSYSRRSRLEQCPRSYYYQYYGSNATKAETEPRKKELRRLKRLSNRYLLSGEILHLVIKKSLEDLRDGEEWGLQDMQDWAKHLFDQSLDISRSFEEGDDIPDSHNGPSLLMEFYYGIEDAESLCYEERDRLMIALKNFAQEPEMSRFKNGAQQDVALIEKHIQKELSGISISGKVDLAYPTFDNGERSVEIVDWKLGGSKDGNRSLQLLTYGVAAADYFDSPLDSINLYQARLTDGQVDSHPLSTKEAREVRCRILQDIEKMRELHVHGQKAERAAFPQCRNPAVCSLCRFQKLAFL